MCIRDRPSVIQGSFAQYFSNIDFSKFRPGVDPAQLRRMLTWMTEGYMNEKQRAGVPLRLEDILADYSGWEEMLSLIHIYDRPSSTPAVPRAPYPPYRPNSLPDIPARRSFLSLIHI